MAHVEKREQGRWRARYRGPDGRERSKTFARRVDAERYLHEVERDKARGEWLDPKLGQITFAEWVEDWRRTIVDVRPNTRELLEGVLRNHLVPRFGSVQLAKITTVDAQAYIAELIGAGTHSSSMIRKIGQGLKRVMEGAVEAGYIARSPCARLRLPAESSAEPRFLTAEQVVELGETITPHYRPLIYAATYGGLRWGELAGLRPERVNVLKRSITVVEQLTEVNGTLAFGPPKTAAGRRTVAIPGLLAEMLAEQLASPCVAAYGLMFPSQEGTPLRRSNFRRRAWGTATRRAGLEGLKFHELRHTAVALAIAQGAHPKSVQERMGHASITVTLDRYGHLFPALDERIADGLDGVLRSALAASPRPGRGLEVVELPRRQA